MKRGVVLIIFILMVSSVSAQLAPSPWPTFRGNLKNTGLSPYDTSHVDGSIKWETQIAKELGVVIESSLSIDKEGNLYFSSHENKIYSLYPDGTIRWEFVAGEPKVVGSPTGDVTKGAHATPAIAEDGTVYARTLSGYLFALTSEGEEIWKYPIYVDEDSWSSPTIGEDGTIYVGASHENSGGKDGYIHAVNPDGTKKWDFETESDVFPTIAINDGVVYSGNGGSGKFYAINSETGILKWSYQTNKHIESSAAIGSDGTLYFGSWDNKIYAIDSKGKKKWSYQTGGEGIVASPGIGPDGTIYVNANDGYLYALNPNGSLEWKHYFREYYETSSSPTIGADGTIYVGVPGAKDQDIHEPSFFAFNPDGTIKWSSLRGTPSASPTIGADGTVYIVTNGGAIYAFGGPEDGEKFVDEVFQDTKQVFEEAEIEPEPFIPYGVNIGEWFPEGDICNQEEFNQKCMIFFATHPEYDPTKESSGEVFEILEYKEEEKEPDQIIYEKKPITEDLHEEPKQTDKFFSKLLDWLGSFFG